MKTKLQTLPLGMMKDQSLARFGYNKAFDVLNMRVTTNASNGSFTALNNERGTLQIDNIEVYGTPIGQFVCENYFGVFSADIADGLSHITIYEKNCRISEENRGVIVNDDDSPHYREVLHYRSHRLGFEDVASDSEKWKDGVDVVVSPESSIRKRIYWVDGVHELKVIDIARLMSMFSADENGVVNVYDNEDGYTGNILEHSYFSYLPVIKELSDVSIGKSSSGFFFSGTVQFFITEVVNENESNIAYYSPVHYVSKDSENRGLAPDNDSDGIGFTLSMTVPYDPKSPIDEIVVYAVHRQIQNGTPKVYKKEVQVDAATSRLNLYFTGEEEVTDNTRLLFKNSSFITGVHTIEQKDNTLFIGNYNTVDDVTEESRISLSDIGFDSQEIDDGVFTNSGYMHKSQLALTSFDIGHFKHNEWYALGYQIMDDRGHWNEPVFIGFKKMEQAPSVANGKAIISKFKASGIDIASVIGDGKAIRPVVAYLGDAKKRCLYQGILAPTIFNESDRVSKRCYAMYSPFLRCIPAVSRQTLHNPPVIACTYSNYDDNKTFDENILTYSMRTPFDTVTPHVTTFGYPINRTLPTKMCSSGWLSADGTMPNSYEIDDGATYPAWQHLEELGTNRNYSCEMQTSWQYRDVVYRTQIVPPYFSYMATDGTRLPEADKVRYELNDNSKFFVDTTILSMHSPDVKMSTSVNGEMSVCVCGFVSLGGYVSDTSIVASTPYMFNKNDDYTGQEGFAKIAPADVNGKGKCALQLPNWCASYAADSSGAAHNDNLHWAVAPFSSDFLSPIDTEDGIEERKDSKLTYKQLSNFRFCDRTVFEAESQTVSCHVSSSVFSGYAKIGGSHFYMSTVDMVVQPNTYSVWSNFCDTHLYEQNPLPGSVKIKCYYQIQKSIRSYMWNAIGWTANPLLYNFVPLAQMYQTNESIGVIDTGVSGDASYYLSSEGTNVTNPVSGSEQLYFHYMHVDSKDIPKVININLKYRATPHLIVDLGDGNPLVGTTTAIGRLFTDKRSGLIWSDEQNGHVIITGAHFSTLNQQESEARRACDHVMLAEVINNDYTPTEDDDVTSYTEWIIAGDAIWKDENGDVPVDSELVWRQGDWYFQRWECLRTYAENIEDKNQVVEIVSFYVETRRNIDGRYDRNRGQAKLNANPDNFDLINDAYTQLPNYNIYYKASRATDVITEHPNTVSWTLPKVLNSKIDEWTNLNGVSTIDLDGKLEPIVKITKMNDKLVCFQPKGISEIMYNSRTQLTTTAGVPIEIANSGKVDGKQYVTMSSGAKYKRNICNTGDRLYYSDAYNNAFMTIAENGFIALSEVKGMYSWLKHKNADASLVTYDNYNGCIYFTDCPFDLTAEECVNFSPKIDAFESFFSYYGMSDVINIQDDTLLLHKDDEDEWHICRINAGRHNDIYGKLRRYHVTMVVNFMQSQKDIILDNISFQGDRFDDTDYLQTIYSPFNKVRAVTEWQDSEEVDLKFVKDWHQNVSNIKQKFRIWHAISPRQKEVRYGRYNNRIRNPWVKLSMIFDPENEEENMQDNRAIVNDFIFDVNVM